MFVAEHKNFWRQPARARAAQSEAIAITLELEGAPLQIWSEMAVNVKLNSNQISAICLHLLWAFCDGQSV